MVRCLVAIEGEDEGVTPELSDYDAIVVGSGAGGLSAALGIAQRSHSVLLLEAEPFLGGCLCPLQLDGYHFDVGVHYLGELGEGQRFWNCLHELGLTDKVEFIELNPDSIDRYVFPDFELRLCKGKDRLKEQLIQIFPKERVGIDKFFRIFDRVANANESFLDVELRPIQQLVWMLRNPIMLKYGRAPYQALLNTVSSDIRLQTALSALWFDYMLPPRRASVAYGIGAWHHYLSGGYYPRGGSRALRDAFIAALNEHGAAAKVSCRVSAIERRGDHFLVTGSQGAQWTSKVVVSDADPSITLGKLVSQGLVPKRVAKKAARLRPSGSVFGVFIGTDLDLPSLGMTTENLVHYGAYNVNEIFKDMMDPESPDLRKCILINSPSVRCLEGGLTPKARHSVQILAAANYSAFERWERVPLEKRGVEYNDFVKALGEQLISIAERYIPGLSQHMKLVHYMTPLSLENRVNLIRGGIYGPELTPAQVGPGRFHDGTCGVAGLFLAGAGTMGGGVRYCITSGLKAARKATAFLQP